MFLSPEAEIMKEHLVTVIVCASLSLNPVHAVFQGLLCGGCATEEAAGRKVPESLGGA